MQKFIVEWRKVMLGESFKPLNVINNEIYYG